MKKVLLLTLIIVIISKLSAQENPLTFTSVVHVDSTLSNTELFLRAKQWFAETYTDSKSVIQMEDKESGKIIGKAVIPYSQSFLSGYESTKGYVNYTIKIFAKQGRYKYVITDFIHKPYTSNKYYYSVGLITTDEFIPNPKPMAKKWSNRVWVDVKGKINDEMPTLIESLKTAMEKKSSNADNNDDW